MQKNHMSLDLEINTKYLVNIMDFNNIEWTNDDFNKYRKYLLSLKNTEDKIIWRNKIVKTNMPMLAIYQKDIKTITNKILKSNVLNFLNNVDFKYYERSEEHTSELQSRPHLVCR